MTIFRSLVDALHAGYKVLGAIEGGYLLRLTREDETASFGIVILKPNRDLARSTALTRDYAFDSNMAERSRIDACLADFALSCDRGVAIVKVNGDIDDNNVAAFKAVVDCAAMTGFAAMVVALTMTEYVCRRAYRILSALQGELESVDRCLCISCDPNCRPRRMLPLLAMPFPIFDNIDDAIAAVRPRACIRERNEFRNPNRSKRP